MGGMAFAKSENKRCEINSLKELASHWVLVYVSLDITCGS